MRFYFSDRFYKCFICGKIYKFSDYLYIYMRVYFGEKFYKCDECVRIFFVCFNLNFYKKLYFIKREKFMCFICFRIYRLRELLVKYEFNYKKNIYCEY